MVIYDDDDDDDDIENFYLIYIMFFFLTHQYTTYRKKRTILTKKVLSIELLKYKLIISSSTSSIQKVYQFHIINDERFVVFCLDYQDEMKKKIAFFKSLITVISIFSPYTWTSQYYHSSSAAASVMQ